ncbi:Hypothetical protein GLP15_4144 [Giardia lamblia P15]|uniref:Uncharacterized protein n=1 Tax=Giardia intestinalis (strain P15) TaxID=658858 RepID=E1F0H3_GIAIA|nr:Hypothetical protein GLP15_4144 [Giardia lamblia P15]
MQSWPFTSKNLAYELQEYMKYHYIGLAVIGSVLLLLFIGSHVTARRRYNKKLLGLSRSHVSLKCTNAVVKKVTDNIYLVYLDRPMIVFLSPVSGTLLIANPLALEESQMRFFEDITSVSNYEDAVSIVISTSSRDDTQFYKLRYPNAKVFRSITAYETYISKHTEFSQVALQRPHRRTDNCGDALILINDISAPSHKKRKEDNSQTNNIICCLPKTFCGSNKITCNRFMREAFAQTLLSMTTTSANLSQRLSAANSRGSRNTLGRNVFLGLSPNVIITYQGEVFLGREMCDAILIAGAEALKPGSTVELREH